MQPPRVRLISTGSEITQGLYPDTNAQALSRLLFENGFRVIGHAAAPDERPLIRRAIADAFPDCDLIISTGGLGPTEDDVNREVIAELYGLPLEKNTRAEAMMRDRFSARGIPMPERNVVQALIPREAIILYNHWGTAPGFLIPAHDEKPAFAALPGPPSEWKPMLERALEQHLGPLFPARPRREGYTLHLAMVPESLVNQALADLFAPTDAQELTILASRGHIRLRIIATETASNPTAQTIDALRSRIVQRLGRESIFAEGPDPNDTLPAALLRLFQSHHRTLALAESCTGGWVAKALTDVPGSSETLLAGWVTYSNAAKQRDLSVPADLLETHGAVSEPVVRAMAEAARRLAGADYSLAISGVAGPGGGSPEKPVGTVWFAVAGPDGTTARRRLFKGDRESVRGWSVIQGIEFLRRALLRIDPDAILAGENPQSASK